MAQMFTEIGQTLVSIQDSLPGGAPQRVALETVRVGIMKIGRVVDKMMSHQSSNAPHGGSEKEGT